MTSSPLSRSERAALDAILEEALIERELAALGREVDRAIARRNAARKKKAKALAELLKSQKR